tara:strand:+ start:1158 stop:1454 length:297 start_codon:yes stop_codon:yes gene_type:complete
MTEQKNHSFKPNYLVLFGYLLLIIGICLFTFYFTTSEINSCTSDPLTYSIKFIRNRFEVETVSGIITATDASGAKITEYFGDNQTQIRMGDWINVTLP